VSLLERLGRGHLSDAQFAKYWAEPKLEGSRHPHLAACEACRTRYDAFEHWVMDIGDELRDEADEAFTGERLAVQQAQISRRLESLERPGRIIAFPKAARAVISGHSHVRRWVTAAAAAGLIAGISLDQVLPRYHQANARFVRSEHGFNSPEATARAKSLQPLANSQNDDELLSDDFSRPNVSALSALDDMTPHVRDVIAAETGK
jgi:hypothetical protein